MSQMRVLLGVASDTEVMALANTCGFAKVFGWLKIEVVALPSGRLPPTQLTSESFVAVPVLPISIPGAPEAMLESLAVRSTVPLRSAIRLLPTASSSIASFTAHPLPVETSVVVEPATTL